MIEDIGRSLAGLRACQAANAVQSPDEQYVRARKKQVIQVRIEDLERCQGFEQLLERAVQKNRRICRGKEGVAKTTGMVSSCTRADFSRDAPLDRRHGQP